MFARSAARAAFQSRPALRQTARRYATEPPPPPPPRPQQQATFNSTTALFVGAIVIAIGGGYVAIKGTSNNSVAQKAQAKVKEVVPGLAPKKALTGGDQGFISLKLEDVEIINHNTKKLRFKLPEEDMVSGVHIASAILTKFKPADAEKAVIRPYTPVNDEDAPGYLDLLIKKYEGGPMSTYLHDLVPGQRLDIKGPLPKYPWEANKHDHIALVAGGTGITPMWQLVRAIFNNPADKTKVTLVFGNLSEKDILLKKELAELENTYPQRFRAFYVLDNPPKEWAGNSGHITSDLLKTVLPEPKADNIKVFVCGPPGLMKAISGAKNSPADQGELSGILSQLGYTKEQVYKF